MVALSCVGVCVIRKGRGGEDKRGEWETEGGERSNKEWMDG